MNIVVLQTEKRYNTDNSAELKDHILIPLSPITIRLIQQLNIRGHKLQIYCNKKYHIQTVCRRLGKSVGILEVKEMFYWGKRCTNTWNTDWWFIWQLTPKTASKVSEQRQILQMKWVCALWPLKGMGQYLYQVCLLQYGDKTNMYI